MRRLHIVALGSILVISLILGIEAGCTPSDCGATESPPRGFCDKESGVCKCDQLWAGEDCQGRKHQPHWFCCGDEKYRKCIETNVRKKLSFYRGKCQRGAGESICDMYDEYEKRYRRLCTDKGFEDMINEVSMECPTVDDPTHCYQGGRMDHEACASRCPYRPMIDTIN